MKKIFGFALMMTLVGSTASAQNHYGELRNRFLASDAASPVEVRGAWSGRCYGSMGNPNMPFGALMFFDERPDDQHGPGFPGVTTLFGFARHQDPRGFDGMDSWEAENWLAQRHELFMTVPRQVNGSLRIAPPNGPQTGLRLELRMGPDGYIYLRRSVHQDDHLYCYFFQNLSGDQQVPPHPHPLPPPGEDDGNPGEHNPPPGLPDDDDDNGPYVPGYPQPEPIPGDEDGDGIEDVDRLD